MCCRGTSGGLQAQPWTRRAGRSPRSGTGAPLEDKQVGDGEIASVFSHFNYHSIRSSMTMWLNKWLFSDKEKNLERNKDVLESFIILL